MNRFWCPFFADWLERNNMNCFFWFIYRGGCLPSMHYWSHDQGVCIRGSTSRGGSACRVVCIDGDLQLGDWAEPPFPRYYGLMGYSQEFLFTIVCDDFRFYKLGIRGQCSIIFFTALSLEPSFQFLTSFSLHSLMFMLWIMLYINMV